MELELKTKFNGGHTETIICIAANNNQHLATGAEGSQLCLWDQASGKVIYKTSHNGGSGGIRGMIPDGDVTSVCFSRTQPHNLYCSVDSTICLYDTRCMDAMVTKFQYNKEEINQLTLHPKDTYLAACDDSGHVRIVDVQQRKLYKTLRRHTNICSSICFHPKLPWHLASGGLDCAVFTWDFSRGKVFNSLNTQELNHEDSTSAQQTAYSCNPPLVHSVSYSPSGTLLACGLENSMVHVLDFPKRSEVRVKRTLKGHTQGVSQVCFHGNDLLVSAGNDGRIILWDMTVYDEGKTLGKVENGQAREEGACSVPQLQSDLAKTDISSRGQETGAESNSDEKTESVYKGTESSSKEDRTHVKVDHGDKINSICPVKLSGSDQRLLFVADQSEVVTVYQISN